MCCMASNSVFFCGLSKLVKVTWFTIESNMCSLLSHVFSVEYEINNKTVLSLSKCQNKVLS